MYACVKMSWQTDERTSGQRDPSAASTLLRRHALNVCRGRYRRAGLVGGAADGEGIGVCRRCSAGPTALVVEEADELLLLLLLLLVLLVLPLPLLLGHDVGAKVVAVGAGACRRGVERRRGRAVAREPAGELRRHDDGGLMWFVRWKCLLTLDGYKCRADSSRGV